jgi:Oxygenase domain of the 2OGFeDO superfamily
VVRTIHLFSSLTDEAAEAMKATYLDWRHCGTVIGGEDVDVFKPDGSPLLMFRRQVLPADVCERARPALRHAARTTNNRGIAAGGQRIARVKRDGTASKTTDAAGVDSGIIGYFDRTAREPFCRATAFTWGEVRMWRTVQPFIHAVDRMFARELPDRYEAQMRAVRATPPEYVIRGTAFATVTVNRNYVSAVHQDKGDLKEGFGVLSVLRGGEYEGGLLVFPQYRVAVDLRTRDVLLADVHEWHGNTALDGEEGEHERLSCVFYFRSGMRHCLPPAQELEWVKRRQAGEPLRP